MAVLSATLLVLHVIGYAWPSLVLGIPAIRFLILPMLLCAAFLLPRFVQVPKEFSRKDRTMRLGIVIFSFLLGIEMLLFLAVVFDVVRQIIPFADIVQPHSRADYFRFAYLMVFSVAGMWLFPLIIG